VLKLCFVGLGNPGSKYNNTRHNIGKDWLLKLCKSESVKLLNKTKFEADLAYSESEEILYVVPNNYVNNSGRTISKLVKNLNLSESENNYSS
jgi:PTH1 family peptidyl-tRNA hydrolase